MNELTSRIVEIMKNKNISASDLSKKIKVQKSTYFKSEIVILSGNKRYALNRGVNN